MVLLWPGQALAQDVIVDCDGGDDLQAAIDDLHITSGGVGGTIEVSGLCTNNRRNQTVNEECEGNEDPSLPLPWPENQGVGGVCRQVKLSERFVPFNISNFTELLTIEAHPTDGATLGQLLDSDFPTFPDDPDDPGSALGAPVVVDCDTDRNTLFRRPNRVLQINDSQDVRLEGLIIDGGNGILINNSDVRFEGGVVVQNSLSDGVFTLGSAGSVVLRRGMGNEIIGSCRHGINVGHTLSAIVGDDALIQFNARFGMIGRDGARLDLRDEAVVDANGWGGIHGAVGTTVFISGNATISGNGTDTSTVNLLVPRFLSGVSIYAGSNLTVVGAPNITDNFGAGIILDITSVGRLLGMNVNGNTEEGFLALKNSTAEFIPEFGLNTISGNGSGDVACDNTAVLVGDFSEVGVNNCASTGGGGGGGPGGGGPPN